MKYKLLSICLVFIISFIFYYNYNDQMFKTYNLKNVKGIILSENINNKKGNILITNDTFYEVNYLINNKDIILYLYYNKPNNYAINFDLIEKEKYFIINVQIRKKIFSESSEISQPYLTIFNNKFIKLKKGYVNIDFNHDSLRY